MKRGEILRTRSYLPFKTLIIFDIQSLSYTVLHWTKICQQEKNAAPKLVFEDCFIEIKLKAYASLMQEAHSNSFSFKFPESFVPGKPKTNQGPMEGKIPLLPLMLQLVWKVRLLPSAKLK